MSKNKITIEVVPPDRRHDEVFSSGKFVCPYCSGRGGFAIDGPDVEKAWETCPDCDGTGELTATITIEWKPNKH